MEMATYFFCRCSDLYLNNDGIIAFIMPRSVLTGALHHANFKRFKKPKNMLYKIFDLEDVVPLFNVPSCVLIAVKGKDTKYPISAKRYRGKLSEKNIRLKEVIRYLSAEDYLYNPPLVPTKYSWYYGKVKKGIDITPRCFWFVEFEPHPMLGIDVNKPSVKTAESILSQSKERWKGIIFSGNVENDFIFTTLLAGDIVSFGYTQMRPVVLPVESHTNHFRLLEVAELRNRGYRHMADWVQLAQDMWEKNASKRSLMNFPRVVSWLNYMNKLDAQSPIKQYAVVYNASGTNIASCVVDRKKLPEFSILQAKINPNGFLAEQSTFFYETNDEMEAHYLCAVLNSNVINDLIKPLQPRGLFGERAVTRRPFMFYIPKFDKSNDKHRELAEISKKCHEQLANKQFEKKRAADTRSEAREIVNKEIKRIDELVSELLGL
jgi:hypothetical protein